MAFAKPPTAHFRPASNRAGLFALSALTIAAFFVSGLSPDGARAEWWHKRRPVVTGPAATLIRGGPVYINAIDGKEHRRVDAPQLKIPAGRRRIDLCVWAGWKKKDGSPLHVPLCGQEVVEKKRRGQNRILVQTGGPFPNPDRLFRKGLRIRPRQVVYDFVPNKVYRITAELLDKPWSFREDGWRVRLERQRKRPDGRTTWEILYGAVRAPTMTEAFPPYSRREQPLPSGWRPFPQRPKNPYAMLNADGSTLGADGTLEGIDGEIDFNAQPAPGSAELPAKMSPAAPPSSRETAVTPPYWLPPPPLDTIQKANRGTPRPARSRPSIGSRAAGILDTDGSPPGADGARAGLAGAPTPTPTGAAIFTAPAKTAAQPAPQPDPAVETTAAAVTRPAAEPPAAPDLPIAPAAGHTSPPAEPAKTDGPAPPGGFTTIEKEIELPAETAEPETPSSPKATAEKTGEKKKEAERKGAAAEIVTTVETAEPDTPITPGIEIPPRPEMAEKKAAKTAGGPNRPK